MQVKRIQNGVLRILISDRELGRLGASFSSLREKDPHTRRVIGQILTAVCSKVDLPFDTILSIEAAPVDGGCLLLVTPRTAPPERGEDIYIFSFQDGNALLSFAAGVSQTDLPADEILSSSLFLWEGGYRLILYCTALPDNAAAILGEFTEPVGTGLIEATRTAEYGEAVYIGDALSRLTASAPLRSAPPDRPL